MARPYKRRPKHIVSYTMSQIKSKDTGIEYYMNKALRLAGLSFRRHYNILGSPDFALPVLKLAVFCDSDFWHGYKWEKRKPRMRANRDYWIKKMERNMARDKKVNI